MWGFFFKLFFCFSRKIKNGWTALIAVLVSAVSRIFLVYTNLSRRSKLQQTVTYLQSTHYTKVYITQYL